MTGPLLSRSPEPPGVPPRADVPLGGDPHAASLQEATLDALLATGASLDEALGLLAQAHGVAAVLPRLMALPDLASPLRNGTHRGLEALRVVGATSPDLALAGLGAFLDRWGGRPINGSLWLGACAWAVALPAGLVLDDALSCSLDLDDSGIVALPEGLKVGGSLSAERTALTAVPEGTEVGGNLMLRASRITCLPEGLKVPGELELNLTPIAVLPKGLVVGRDLWLTGTQVRVLPPDLKVGGSLDLQGTPLTVLPDGLVVNGDLNLKRTPVVALPTGLLIRKDLWLQDCRRWDGRIPEDAVIKGRILTDGHPHPGIPLPEWRALHPNGERNGG
jgi:hypothetical protein